MSEGTWRIKQFTKFEKKIKKRKRHIRVRINEKFFSLRRSCKGKNESSKYSQTVFWKIRKYYSREISVTSIKN